MTSTSPQQLQPPIVILGASVSGLCTAAALAPHLPPNQRILLLDKDEALVDPTACNVPRKGTPQDQQIHVLLEGGRSAMESLLPGFTAAFLAAGAVGIDRGADLPWFQMGAWKKRYVDGNDYFLLTRPHVDVSLRKVLLATYGDKVEIRHSARATGLRLDAKKRVVEAVVVDDGSAIDASLVVDAMGSTSPLEKWLEAVGSPRPRTQEVKFDLAYASQWFEVDPLKDNMKTPALAVYPLPHNKRAVVIVQLPGSAIPSVVLESPDANKKYVKCTVFGYQDDKPSGLRTPQEFLDYVAKANRPAASQYLDGMKPLGNPVIFTKPSQFWRRYDKVARMPKGLLVVGDATASLDPAFGQGMSAAAIGAKEVVQYAKALTRRAHPDCRRAQRAVAGVAWLPYTLNAIEDHRYAGTTGDAPPLVKILHKINARLFRTGSRDETVLRTTYKVANLEAPPTLLARPDIVFKIMWRGGAYTKKEKAQVDPPEMLLRR